MKILAAVLISGTILVAGCKKAKDGTNGTQGPQGPAGVVTTSSDGFIKGTITGTHRDGTGFSETFNYTNYWGGPSATLDSTTFGYNFKFTRGTDILSANNAEFFFSVTSLTATTAPFYINNFEYTSNLSGNRLFDFTVNSSTSGTITGMSYTPSTGKLTGNYTVSMTSSDNNSNHAATMIGSFEVTATKLYYRTVKNAPVTATAKQD